MAGVMSKQFSILELFKRSSEYLAKKGIFSSKVDTEWILSKYLNIDKIDIYLDRKYVDSESQINQIRDAIVRRGKREPLQHILGSVEFCNCTIKSDPRALIPRFETEVLVELIEKRIPKEFNGRILDLGTGSGAILIALSKLYPDAQCVGLDKSDKALSLAKENLKLNKCNTNVKLCTHDWHLGSPPEENFDLLVSNPPYLSHQEWSSCEPEVKKYDPKDALVAENDGMLDLETILELSNLIVRKGGLVALEFGTGQSDRICSISKKYFRNVTVENDLTGKRRFFLGILNN
jgi:release factor glutamine methyltransferase